MPGTIDAGDSRLVTSVLAAERGVPAGLDLRVSVDDEMLRHAIACHGGDREAGLAAYFVTGLSIFLTWRRLLAWRFGSLDELPSLLDFAAGYGRVSRFLAAALPEGVLAVSDVDPSALEFQRRTFGVSTVPSGLSPAGFAPDRTFACILATSLFTHLPERRFPAWLGRLWEHLEPGGMLAFTTHDTSLLPGGHPGRDADFHFAPTSESRSLAGDDYGSAWVSSAFLDRCLEALPKPISVHRVHRGLTSFHDVTVAVRTDDVDFSGLELDRGLAGRLERCQTDEEGRLRLGGWAADAGGLGPPTVAVSLDGTEIATVPAGGRRDDVTDEFEGHFGTGYGWTWEGSVGEPDIVGSAPLVVRVHADDERSQVIFAGSVHAALLASSRQRISELERDLERREERIEWMERSRFWRLRNRWFALKRALRLTDEE